MLALIDESGAYGREYSTVVDALLSRLAREIRHPWSETQFVTLAQLLQELGVSELLHNSSIVDA